MPVAWHPRRWQEFQMPEDNTKEIESFLIDEKIVILQLDKKLP